MRKLVTVENPSLEQIVASLAASIFVLSPEGIAELHAAVDDLAKVGSEAGFTAAKAKLAKSLTMRVKA